MSVPETAPSGVRLRPASVAEVVEALEAARSRGRRLVPSGGGSSGAPLPPQGAWSTLRLDRLRGMEEHEPGDLTFTARPGMTLGELDGLLAPHGQWLPVDPAGGPERTLGGLVATGLGGALHAGYGAVRDLVLGLTLVTGDGRVLRLGGRVMKNVAGFDLVRPVVGSRGQLGAVVSVSMRLFPRPRAETVLVLDGVGTEALLQAARGVATAPVVPASAAVVRVAGRATAGDEGALVVRLHGAPASVAADRTTLEAAAGASFRVAEGSTGAVLSEDGGVPGPRGEAGELVELVRDAGTGGPLAFRQGGLPAELPGRWRAFRRALPDAELRADVFSGVLAGSLGREDAGAVARVRAAAAEGGRPVLFSRLPEALHGSVERWDGPEDGGLAEALRARFDPHGTLAAWGFGR